MIRLLTIRTLWALLALMTILFVAPTARADDAFLDPAVAFQLSTRVLADKRVELTYKIAPGYYLYRERFKFSSTDAKLGEPQIPPGKKHYDTALEENVETYHDQVVLLLPVLAGGKTITIAATHQGCAEKGLCYPPQPRTVNVTMKAFGASDDSATVAAVADESSPGPTVGAVVALPVDKPVGGMSTALGTVSGTGALRSSLLGDAAPASAPPNGAVDLPPVVAASAPAPSVAVSTSAPAAPESQSFDDRLVSQLQRGGLLLILPLAFIVGLALSLTPCILPMIPILSSIIVGQGQSVTRTRGLALAVAYSLGMALVYTALGVAAGLLGAGLAAYLQNPWVLVSFGALLVLLSLSMFGFYELQLPAFLRDKLSSASSSLSGGQLGGVFAMGALSALIVSPCVSAPLGGVLLYIANTGNAVLGGAVLFVMAIGMSAPLLAVGASAGTLLPRTGAWMDRIKQLFGLLLIAVAVYVMSPVLPHALSVFAWGTLLVSAAIVLGAFESLAAARNPGAARAAKVSGIVLFALGVAVIAHSTTGIGGASSAAAGSPPQAPAGPRFDRVVSVAQLDQRLQTAGRPVMLDFYADWCVSCKEMESQTFVDPAVQAKLANAVLLRADVTANNEDDRALLKRFHLFGPPGIILFDAQGHEIESARVVGFRDARAFSGNLAAVGL